MLFAVILEHGHAWDALRSMREQEMWDEHAVFMDDLTAEGFVVLGGPLGERAGALLIINAENEETIRPRLAADPWLPAELLQIAMIEPWTILLRGESVLASEKQ